ncbi:YbbR-like domain-containing protein [Phaeocystidibacter marisrubri]|uniref:YbbR-like domain-containing protein n=1 Tax=Phaeocystidibacter marisrubri TaxID=1577780 RepID=A0A6L3ZJN0_9FLAO|nr:hypothetical protein [Phaeocystidibacter marisrubri]KAB2817839.1 hypothetical protein F8C82_05395 [Phaeocystidibacter marisrubri]GGH73264.1 hypothetical protein GCM10011318_18110 [Phaeocystidibacter marisrubri]
MNQRVKKDWKNKRSIWLTRLVFLLLSAFIWGLLKLGNSNIQTTITVPLKLMDVPQDIMFVEPLNEVDVRISAPALYAFREEWTEQDSVRISFNRFTAYDDQHYYLKSASFIQATQNYQPGSVDWIRLADTTWVNTSSLAKVKIELRADFDLDFIPPYYRYKKPILTPDSIYVFGPSEVLDTLRYWKLPTITQSAVDGDVNRILPVNLPVGLQSSTKSVAVQQRVEESTVKWVEVSLNNSDYTTKWKAVPEVVNVKCRVPVSDFGRLHGGLFSASYMRLEKGDAVVPIRWNHVPDFVEVLDWSPKYVELIEQR